MFIIIASAVLFTPCHLRAQTQTTDQIIKDANTKFDDEDYAAAMPLYSQLLANDRNNPNYNYRYGVCVLYASSEKEKGLEYLQKASKSAGVDADVWFYLGKAYHLNYQFEQAITCYNKFKSLGGAKKATKYQVDNQIAMCKTGRKLLKAITDITVIEKAELNEADFFRHYDLSGSGYSGQLLVKPDEFKTALDKKKKEQSIIFLSGEKNELFFASYGEDESQGKDIYVVRKLPNGNWGKPENVGYPINTEFDEDYPFMHPNGKVLYFSSKGHNSMGGYDIFRSELNEETNTWQKPVNLDFAINSPDDDIMFVSDLDEKTAWFASSRNSPEGKMTVYHVVIERKPVNNCLITGIFTPIKGDQNRAAKITVKNSETNEPIGVYNSNEATGSYFINLPNNGGKYSFTIDHTGIATQTNDVIVPTQYQIKALNQQIGYEEINKDSKLFIRTDYATDTSMLDPSFLKDKAKLDINNEPVATQITDMGHSSGTIPKAGTTDSSDSNEDDSTTTDSSTGVPSSHTGVSNEELVKTANDDAIATQSEATDLDAQKDRAFNYASQLNEQAKSKTQEAAQAKNTADVLPEGPDKKAAEQKAADLIAAANALQTQVAASTSMAQALEADAKNKQQEADKAKQYATSLDKAVKSKDSKALDDALAKQLELQAMSDTRPESESTAKNLQIEADKKDAELEKAKTSSQDMKEEIAKNQQRIGQLKAEEAKEKDPELKKGIEAQIEGINEDIADDEKLLVADQKKVELLQNQSNDLNNQAKAANDVIVQSKNPAVSSTPISIENKNALSKDAIAYQQSSTEIGTSKVYAPVTGTQTAGVQTTDTQTTGTQTAGVQTTDTQTTGTQTSVTQTTDTQIPGNDSTNTVVADENPDSAYSDALQKADTISDPIAREKAKGEVYSNWAANIDDQINEKKQEIAGTKDKTKKAELNADLKKLQASSEQKKQDSKNSVAAANKAEKDKIAQQGTQQVALPDDQFVKQISAADQNPSEVEKENKKAQVYSDWADALDSTAVVKENNLTKIKNKTQQEKAKQEIVAIRADAESKRNLSDEAKTKATEAETASQTTGTQSNPTEVHYDSPEANSALQEQKQLVDQANQNRQNKDSLSNLASTKEGDEKNQLLKAATEQQRQAWEKDAQASAKMGDANKLQFEKNNNQLNGFDAAAVNSNDPSVSTASLLSDESKKLFEKAKQDRATAVASDNNYIKNEALQSAEENEKKALQKQQDAFTLYKKSGIQPIAVTQTTDTKTSGTQTAGTQTTDTQTTGTHPTDTQTTDTQTAGTQTTDTQTTGTQTTDTQTTGTQSTNTQTTGTQTTGTQTTDTQTTGTQTFGTQTTGTQSTNTQTTGTQTTNTQTTGTQTTNTAMQEIVDPTSGQPFTSNQLNQIRSSDPFKNYTAANLDAVNSENNSANLKLQADSFQLSANSNVAKAQDIALQAADEKDQTKKKELIAESKKYNSMAKNDMGSRDSLEELVDVELMNANANHNKANLALQGLDQPAINNIKIVAKADQTNSGDVARTGTQTADTQTTGSQTAGTQTADTQTTGTQTTGTQTTGAQPADTQTTGAQTSGTQTTDTQTTGTQTTGTQTADTQTTGAQTAGAQTSGTQTADTQTTGAQTTGTQTADTQTTGAQTTGTQTADTQTTGTQTKAHNTNTSSVSSRLSPGEQFAIVPKTSSTPITVIKINPSLPEGLVYKVQIGAFRNPISSEIYKGIAPVCAETTASGLTRYTAGLFKEFANADAAKVEIRGMGYPDAFVVAFYNGKRISIDEARRLKGDSGMHPITETHPENGTQTSDTQTTGTQTTDAQTTNNPDKGNQSYQGNTTGQDVKQVKGLFFTVQIGVYKNQVSNSKLKNLPEIVNEKTANGFIRYSSGKYCSVDAAVVAKDKAVSKGITDAFVTAYYNGKRITPAEAQSLIETGVSPCAEGQKQTSNNSSQTSNSQTSGSQGTQPSNNGSQTSSSQGTQPSNNGSPASSQGTQPSNSGSQTSNNGEQGTQNSSTSTLSTKPPVPETGLVFSVQIGAFREEVPVEIANQFLQLSSKGVKNYLDGGTGLTVYQVGVCVTKEEAEALRAEAVAKGITDAFIVAFKDGKKITMEEAMQLLGQ